MLTYRKYRRIVVVACTTLSILACTGLSARAHFPWINLEDGHISSDKNLKWTVGWGHRFPMAALMKEADVEAMVIIGPDGGGQSKAVSTSELEFQSAEGLGKAGAYLVAVKRKASFYTKTTEGSKRQSKVGLTNVLSCSRSNSFMKAVANVDTTNGKVDTVVGHAMEIIPLVNPASLRVGDYLPFRVLFKGKPYRTEFSATYGGFSTEDAVWAYAAGTDKDGLGKVKILSSGAWLIKVNLDEPFADPKECDKESYLATLTFEVP
ncbi:MAG: DUF4198 domain-containing protein [Pseudomonadota bacterium]